MTDSVKVEAVKDNLLRNQWGKNPFLFRDGKKLSIDRKKLLYALIGAFVLLAIVQLLFGKETSLAPKANPIELSSTQLSGRQIKLSPAELDAERVPSKQDPKTRLVRTFSGPQVVARPRNLKAIPAGTMGEAVLVTGASNGLVHAELLSGISAGGTTELEPGVLLVGKANSTAERLMVQFSQAVFSDGTMGDINAHACDAEDRIVGLKGSNVAIKALNIAGSIGLGLIGGLAEGLQETHGQQGAVVKDPTIKNALLNATSRTALEQSGNLMSDLQGRKPLIEVPAGKKICVIFGGAR